MWKASVEWGVYTAMSVGTYHGRFALLGGTSQPSIWGRCLLYGAEGKVLAHYARPDLQSWCTPSQFRDMRLADLDGDGKAEIINAVDTDCRQLVVYNEDGKILWDADVAGSAEAVAVASADGTRDRWWSTAPRRRATCTPSTGRTGTRRWACFVGEPTHFVAPTSGGRVIAAARSGRVFAIGHDGELDRRRFAGAADHRTVAARRGSSSERRRARHPRRPPASAAKREQSEADRRQHGISRTCSAGPDANR